MNEGQDILHDTGSHLSYTSSSYSRDLIERVSVTLTLSSLISSTDLVSIFLQVSSVLKDFRSPENISALSPSDDMDTCSGG